MKKDAITIGNRKKEVRADTAKAWRIQNWSFDMFAAWITAALLIFAIFIAGLWIYHHYREDHLTAAPIAPPP